jgi:5'-deoxynucleotidase YfbR-like HD superfamily hydrolase
MPDRKTAQEEIEELRVQVTKLFKKADKMKEFRQEFRELSISGNPQSSPPVEKSIETIQEVKQESESSNFEKSVHRSEKSAKKVHNEEGVYANAE